MGNNNLKDYMRRKTPAMQQISHNLIRLLLFPVIGRCYAKC